MENNREKYFINNYWNYYLELENEFLQVRKYIEFSEGNFKTYSIELLKLYQAVCSEIDVVGKIFASEINSSFIANNKTNILKWWYEVQYKFTFKKSNCAINEYEVRLLDLISIKPWKKFIVEKYKDKKGVVRFRCSKKYDTPTWWKDYNKVKHQRISLSKDDKINENYTKANLKNTAESFGALFILLLAYAEVLNIKDRLTVSKLFEVIKPISVGEIEKLFKVA